MAGKLETLTEPLIGCVSWKNVPVTGIDELVIATEPLTACVAGRLETLTEPLIGCVEGKLPILTLSVVLLRCLLETVVLRVSNF